jgi:hypothetical protein
MSVMYVDHVTGINSIVSILGTTTLSFWPFWESTGQNVTGIAPTTLTPADETAARNLEDEWAPLVHQSGLYSYHFAQAGNQHLAATDNAAHSFGNGTTDSAFSLGAWILPYDITTVAIMAKYDAPGTDREWAWRINGSNKLSLELYDESADTTEIGASSASIALGQWQFVVTTYDGDQATPEVLHYIDGSLDAFDGETTETGAYVAMENGATPLLIGASGTGAGGTPAEEFQGRIALPFIVGGALTAANIADLYVITGKMMGAR